MRICLAGVVMALSGCAVPTFNMPSFSLPTSAADLKPLTAEQQQQALITVSVLLERPLWGTATGTVEASRCDRPSNEMRDARQLLLDDLKMAAFQRGADGMYEVRTTRRGSSSPDCKEMLFGVAQSFKSTR